MINYLTMRALQIFETIKLNGFIHFMQQLAFINKIAVPVEKDLTRLSPIHSSFNKTDMELIEIVPETFAGKGFVYPVKNRYLKVNHYFKKGYRGYALVNGNKVAGDIWYAASQRFDGFLVHPDLQWLGIQSKEGEVYTFDMFLNPEERGRNLATYFQNAVLHELRKKGFKKAYGYFYLKNIPALWVHRTLRWKELEHVRVTRFIIFRKASCVK
jgi:GNAT superfamily N-acetyltransferase